MPKIQWANLPRALRQHLFDRLEERQITAEDLYQLKLWRESEPDAPDGEWYKDFGSFKICGEGKFPKTFLLRGQAARGKPTVEGQGFSPDTTNSREARNLCADSLAACLRLGCRPHRAVADRDAASREPCDAISPLSHIPILQSNLHHEFYGVALRQLLAEAIQMFLLMLP